VKRLDNAEKTTIHNIFTEGEWEKIEGGPSIKSVVIHDYKEGDWQSFSDDSIPGAKYRTMTKVHEMTREQASKFFVNFYKTVFNKTLAVPMKNPFNDIANADPTLYNYIQYAYGLNLFKGNN
jgi:hypothetical protein